MFKTVIGGHPIAISLAGNMYKHETLESLYQNGTAETVLAKKTEIICSWQQVFVNAIFAKYDAIIERSQKADIEESSLKN